MAGILFLKRENIMRTLCQLILMGILSYSFGSYTASAQSRVILSDSMWVSADEVPLLHAQFTQGSRYNFTRQELVKWQADQPTTTYDLTQKLSETGIRCIIEQPEKILALDYPDRVLAFEAEKQKVYKLRSTLEGTSYDIFNPSASSGVYLPDLNALAFFVVPIGTMEENLFTSPEFYRGAPLVGFFRLKGRKAELFRVIGQRDSIYWTRGGVLPHVLHVNFSLHPDGQSIFISQNPVARVERYSLQGELLASFGEEAKHATEDTIIAIPPSLYTKRRETVYRFWATTYLDMYTDSAQMRLYRRYYIGKPLPVAPDSVAKPEPERPPNVCWFDPYLDSIINAMPLDQYGLQVYDIREHTPVLLHDVLLPRKLKLMHTDADRLIFAGRKEDGYWLYEGKIVASRRKGQVDH